MEKEQLVKHEKIPGTPFTLIFQQNTWFIVIGDSRITEPTQTREEQIKKLEEDKWMLILQVAIHVNHKLKEYNEKHLHLD